MLIGVSVGQEPNDGTGKGSVGFQLALLARKKNKQTGESKYSKKKTFKNILLLKGDSAIDVKEII